MSINTRRIRRKVAIMKKIARNIMREIGMAILRYAVYAAMAFVMAWILLYIVALPEAIGILIFG
jgi:hypothetical protein